MDFEKWLNSPEGEHCTSILTRSGVEESGSLLDSSSSQAELPRPGRTGS